ncbi:MAG: phosphoglycerate kinase [Proteobacteria bacterium]|nr:phosphoglycerate kinase [Pseudomonadota bacterium]
MPDVIQTIDTLDVHGKTVLVRVDFNVPRAADGTITDDTRIRAHLPTIVDLQAKDARIVLMSHLGRPGGQRDDKESLRGIAAHLSALLGQTVDFADDCIGPDAEEMAARLNPKGVGLLENLRFHAEEEANNPEFARKLAKLGDVYLNDAFGTAHRAHASTAGIAEFVAQKGIGRLMQQEVNALSKVFDKPKKPVLVISGGSKVSSKIDILRHLVTKADQMMIGGAMANTFLAALGHDMGNSLFELEQRANAKEILSLAGACGCRILLPVDVTVAEGLKENMPTQVADVEHIPADSMALDIGPKTAEQWSKLISQAGTILWNGPVGAFEIAPFDMGTTALAKAIAASQAYSLAGGGDTIAAIAKAGVEADIGYISTGGGSLLEFLEGKELPGIKAVGSSKNAA